MTHTHYILEIIRMKRCENNNHDNDDKLIFFKRNNDFYCLFVAVVVVGALFKLTTTKISMKPEIHTYIHKNKTLYEIHKRIEIVENDFLSLSVMGKKVLREYLKFEMEIFLN